MKTEESNDNEADGAEALIAYIIEKAERCLKTINGWDDRTDKEMAAMKFGVAFAVDEVLRAVRLGTPGVKLRIGIGKDENN